MEKTARIALAPRRQWLSWPADPEGFRRLALHFFLLLAIPASAIGLVNARHFSAHTLFDVMICSLIMLAVIACSLWLWCRPKQIEKISLLLVNLLALGFTLRIIGTFFGPHADLPVSQLVPPYISWLPLLIVLAFVLLQTQAALWTSLLFYAVTALAVLSYALPTILAPGTADPELVALVQQFVFGHLMYIILLSAIPFLQSQYRVSLGENAALRALQLSEDRFHGAFENASIGMALVGLDGRFLSLNDSLCRLLGYSGDELLNLDFQTLTHPDDLENDLQKVNAVLNGSLASYRMEKRYIHRDGNLIWAVLSVSLVRTVTGAPDYFVSQIEDVTAEKRYRDKLIKANETLLAHQTELERSNRELAAFAHNLSHDLREPLRGTRGFARLLQKRCTENLDESGRQHLDFILQATTRADAMVRSLLEYARAGQGSVSEPVDSGTAASTAIRSLRPLMTQTDAIIEVPSHMPVVLANMMELQIVFQNLFSNSIKFSREDVNPEIRVRVALVANTAEFCVADNGIGFDMRHNEDIFNIFRKLQAKEDDSSGVGLAVCRRTIEAHSGRIWATAEPGKGANIWFSLPCATAQNRHEPDRVSVAD